MEIPPKKSLNILSGEAEQDMVVESTGEKFAN
jgi:hypothetical protein